MRAQSFRGATRWVPSWNEAHLEGKKKTAEDSERNRNSKELGKLSYFLGSPDLDLDPSFSKNN